MTHKLFTTCSHWRFRSLFPSAVYSLSVVLFPSLFFRAAVLWDVVVTSSL